MKTDLAFLFMGLLAGGPALAVDVAPAADQIASALLAAPQERRGEATVLGYNAKGEVVTLRKGSNDLICLADDPPTNRSALPATTRISNPSWLAGASWRPRARKARIVIN